MTVDPADVTSMGKALALRADAIAAARERLAQAMGRATWSGAGATRFRFQAHQLDRQLAADADDLRALSASYDRLAEALREELAALKRIEARVRAWLLLNRTLPPPWPVSSLPPSGDPRWREVERAFAAAGIALEAVPVGTVPLPVGAGGTGATGAAGDWKATLSPAEAYIIERESGFDPTARNPTSGAFGLWQGNGSTLDSYAQRFGFDSHTTDPQQQLTMFRAYIKDRYGTAEKAMEFWKKNHSY
jgi:uncharacterized protein YukE